LIRLRNWGVVVASLLGCQAMASSQLPHPPTTILLAEGPPAARRSFVQGLQLGEQAVRACGVDPVVPQWKQMSWDGDPRAVFPPGGVSPLVVAPFAADLRAFGRLAEVSDVRVLLPFQRGHSLNGLKALDAGARLWPLLPSREEDLRSLARNAISRGWRRVMVVSDPSTLQAEAAVPFVELFEGEGGQVLTYTDSKLQAVDPTRPEQLQQLAQDVAWQSPDAIVIAAPGDGELALALRRAQRDGAFTPAAPAWIWLLPADQAAGLPGQPWLQLVLEQPAVGPAWDAFAQDFQRRFGRQPDQLAAAGFETARLLAITSLAPSPISSEGTRDPLGWIDPDAKALPLCAAIEQRRAGERVRLEGVASAFDLRAGQAPSGTARTRLVSAQ